MLSNPLCLGPLFLGIYFIRWLGVGVQLIFLFMILPPRILPPYHMSFSKVLSCLQFCLIGLHPQSYQTGIPYIALTSHCLDIPIGCDIPLLWHPFALTSQTCGIGCVVRSIEFKSDLGHGPHGSDSMVFAVSHTVWSAMQNPKPYTPKLMPVNRALFNVDWCNNAK